MAKTDEIIETAAETVETEKLYTVTSPVANYCGVNAGGVQFAYGKAKVKAGWVLEWYRQHGYKIEESK
jgi:hypothetical protein